MNNQFLFLMSNWFSFLVSIAAIVISIISVVVHWRFARRNIRLSIQRHLMEMASKKARDCNELWDSDNITTNKNRLPYKSVTELTITTELIDKAIEYFGKNDSSIKSFKGDIDYLFWKQLNTSLRIWVKTDHADEELKNKPTFIVQLKGLQFRFKNIYS